MSEQGDGGTQQTNKQSCRSEDWEVCYSVCVYVSLESTEAQGKIF